MDKVQCLFEVMYSRRSIRYYQEEKIVEQDKIIMLLKAAMAAPSACNLQPWEFIIVNEKDRVNKLKVCIDNSNGRYYNAPAAFIVCGNTNYLPWEGKGEMDAVPQLRIFYYQPQLWDLGPCGLVLLMRKAYAGILIYQVMLLSIV